MNLVVIRDIHPRDGMWRSSPHMYFEAGPEALRCINLAREAAGPREVRSVLDFGCGGGRVLRSFEAAFSDASLTACDALPSMVDFCAETFGAIPIYSSQDPDEIPLETYDLIWAGSVFTHMDGERWPRFLRLLGSSLTSRGILVFTTYGRHIAALLRTGENYLNLTPEQAADVLDQYDREGFGYAATKWDGDAVASPSWVCSQLPDDLRLMLYMERAWFGQDVVACAWY